jgi:tRNA threonylcarbamoyladenosine biosynthesis protein TsaB
VIVLAIETATSTAAAALSDEGGLIGSIDIRAGRRHAELLHVAIASLLEMSGVSLDRLAGIAVDVGPGLFTGIRVGVAAAKGYAMALGVPVVGMTSLEILRRGCIAAGHREAVGVVDLRRGELAWSLPPAPGQPAIDRHGPPAELISDLAAHLERLEAEEGSARPARSPRPPLVLAGDGAIRAGEALTAALGDRIVLAGRELSVPPVASLALGALAVLATGAGVDPAEVEPTYLRDADVRIHWTTRHDAPGRHGEVA